jgi:glycosyltransferase involved in cell wall biosynthesis
MDGGAPGGEGAMRILYVTFLWSGLADLVLHGHEEATGMPGFVRPLRRLLELGHRIDLIAGAPRPAPLAAASWLRPVPIELVCWPGRRQLGAALVSPFRLRRAVAAACARQRYDFVYGHGRLGAIACLMARRRGIPCGLRLYGRELAPELLDRPRWATLLRDPLEHLAFTGRKDFLLVTNDGPYGEILYRRLGRPGRYTFLRWRNGCDFPGPVTPAPDPPPQQPFLFFPARIVPWKRQDFGIALLRALHARGHGALHLYFAGPVADPVYGQRLRDEARAQGLTPFVHHLGSLATSQLLPYYRHSAAVLVPYAEVTYGNVAIEALAAGSVLVANEGGPIFELIEDGRNGILAPSADAAAQRLDQLLRAPARAVAMRAEAAAAARRLFEPWDVRVAREIELITGCAGRSPGR